jgi:hypothetical protein
MKVTFWHSADIKPEDNARIKFKKYDSPEIYEGLFIKKEDMFFVGFENESDNFYYSQFIEKWALLEPSMNQIEEIKKEKKSNQFTVKIYHREFETDNFDFAFAIQDLQIEFLLQKSRISSLLKEIEYLNRQLSKK